VKVIIDKEPIILVCYQEIINLDALICTAEPKDLSAAKLAPARDTSCWKPLLRLSQ
jgi:hypothetical protein